MIEHVQTPQGDNSTHPLLMIVLWLLGMAFNYIAESLPVLSWDEKATLVFVWIFRALSLFSLTLIIILNLRKLRNKTEEKNSKDEN